jgi:hypothetical protein
MTRVLLVGYDPESVDFSDPALPPGDDRRENSCRHCGCAGAVRCTGMEGRRVPHSA